MGVDAAPPHEDRKPDYGWDAPYAARNLSLASVACLLAGLFGPSQVTFGSVTVLLRPMFFWTALGCAVEVLLFLHYVKRGKFRHRDYILGLRQWRGDERVLDVGCGRGLLLVGAAKLTPAGHAIGLDVWSTHDLSGNGEQATAHNLALENVASRCELVSAGAQQMPLPDDSIDVVVSNLCLHNMYDQPTRQKAVAEIARVLRPGGEALLSDYKLTGEYAKQLAELGFSVERRWGSFLNCFPPMRVVIARKPRAEATAG